MEIPVREESKGWCFQLIKAAVLGSPIAHSLSPLLHQLAYRELAVDGEYTAIEVSSGGLQGFLNTLDDSWTGFSLTMPLKEEVVGIADVVSDLSSRIASANTLVRRDGRWEASTTDVSGFSYALQSHGVSVSGDVLIIGSGATARAVAAACDGLASRITVMARSMHNAPSISNCVEESDLDFVPWHTSGVIASADLIVCTTPSGAADSLVDLFPINPNSVFFDVLYNPWPTLALSAWAATGGQVIDGLDLLIHQAIAQVEIFSGLSVDRAAMSLRMREAALSHLTSST